MKMVTTEVLENLTYLAAVTQKNDPSLDPLTIAMGLVKMQKLAVTLRGREPPAVSTDNLRQEYDEQTKKHWQRFVAIAREIGIRPTATAASGLISIGSITGRIW